MAIDARLGLSLRRNEARLISIRIIGISADAMAAAQPRMQIRESVDAGGPPLLELPMIANGDLGIYVEALPDIAGVPASMLRIRIPKTSTGDAAIFGYGAIGEVVSVAYGLQWGGVTRLHGQIDVLPSAVDSDAAPDDRPFVSTTTGSEGVEPGATLTIADHDVIQLAIDGAGELQVVIAAATDAAAKAEAARDIAVAQTDALSADAIETIGRPAGVTLTTGEPALKAQAFFLDRVDHAAKLTAIEIFDRTPGTLEVAVFRGSGSTVARVALTTVSALGGAVERQLTLGTAIAVEPGDVLAVRPQADGVYSYTTGGADGGGYYLGPQEAMPETVTLGAATTNIALQVRFVLTYRQQVVTTESFDAVNGQLARLYADETAVIGRPIGAPIVAAEPTQPAQIYFPDQVAEDGRFDAIDLYDRAVGTIEVAAFRSISGTLTRVGLSMVTTQGGNVVRTLPIAAPIAVQAGDILCIRATADGLFSVKGGAQADGAGCYLGPTQPIPTTVQLGQIRTDVLIYVRLRVVSRVQAVTADAFAQLREEVVDAPRGGSPRVALAADVRLPLLGTTSWRGLVAYGQSNSTGYEAKPVLSAAQPYAARTFGGGVHTSKAGNAYGGVVTAPGMTTSKLLVEQETSEGAPGGDGSTMNGETPCTAAAATFVELAAAKTGIDPKSVVVFASSAGHAGYSIAQLSKGSPWYQSVIDHIAGAAALAAAAGKDYVPPVVYWCQGEDDAKAGTSTAAYLAALLKLVADIDADGRAAIVAAAPGRAAPNSPIHFLIAQTASPYAEGTRANLALIRQAQYLAVQQSPLIHFVAPLFSFDPVAGGLHLGNISQRRMGAYVGRAMSDLVVDRCVPDCLWPVSAVASGTLLRVRYRVPTLPIVIDEASFGVLPDKGFVVRDAGGTVPIVAVAVAKAGDVVEIRLARALGANAVVRQGMDHVGSPNRHLMSASGCLRDSTAATSQGQPLWHVAPACEMPVQVLTGDGATIASGAEPALPASGIVATADQIADAPGRVVMTQAERASVAKSGSITEKLMLGQTAGAQDDDITTAPPTDALLAFAEADKGRARSFVRRDGGFAGRVFEHVFSRQPADDDGAAPVWGLALGDGKMPIQADGNWRLFLKLQDRAVALIGAALGLGLRSLWRGPSATDIMVGDTTMRGRIVDMLATAPIATPSWRGPVALPRDGTSRVAIACSTGRLVLMHYIGQSNSIVSGTSPTLWGDAQRFPRHAFRFSGVGSYTAGGGQVLAAAYGDPIAAQDFTPFGMWPHTSAAYLAQYRARHHGYEESPMILRADGEGGIPITWLLKGDTPVAGKWYYENAIETRKAARALADRYGLALEPHVTFIQGEDNSIATDQYQTYFSGLIGDHLADTVAAIGQPLASFLIVQTNGRADGAGDLRPGALAHLAEARLRRGSQVVLAGPMYDCPLDDDNLHASSIGRLIHTDRCNAVRREVMARGTFTPLDIARASSAALDAGQGLRAAGLGVDTRITARGTGTGGTGTYTVSPAQTVSSRRMCAFGAVFTGAIDGDQLTVSAVHEGSLEVGVAGAQVTVRLNRVVRIDSDWVPGVGPGLGWSWSCSAGRSVIGGSVSGDVVTLILSGAAGTGRTLSYAVAACAAEYRRAGGASGTNWAASRGVIYADSGIASTAWRIDPAYGPPTIRHYLPRLLETF